MNRQTQLIISIPNPCHENWDEMTPVYGGKYCNHCNKKVHDFTGFSDRQLYDFFEQNQGAICGLYLHEQVNRPIIIPLQPKSKLYRLSIAMGLTLLFSQPLITAAQSRPPLKQDTLITKSNPIIGPENLVDLNGMITNENHHPVADAKITLLKDGIEVGKSHSDGNGNYQINDLFTGTYGVNISKPGYTTYNTILTLTNETKGHLDFQTNIQLLHKKPEPIRPKVMGVRVNHKLPIPKDESKK